MGAGDKPLWVNLLRAAMDERGVSIRGLGRELHELAPSVKRSSWHRSVRRYLDPSKPTLPSPETARLLARALDKPADYFVMPRASPYERLKREAEDLRKRLDEAEGRGDAAE